MRGGDISNRTAHTVLFDLDLILEQEKVTVKGLGKILNLFQATQPTYKVNRVMRDSLIRLWNNYDIHIGIFTFNLDWEMDERKLHTILFNHYVPYNRIVYCVDEMDLRKERALYLFSGNGELVSTLSDIKALDIKQLPEVFQ